MKINALSPFIIAACLLVAGLTACESTCDCDGAKQDKLAARAKIGKDDATRIALARIPNATLKSAEIEREHGRLIWSFDLNTPGTTDITEVNVDASTGEVVSVEHESAASEAKEKD